MYIKTNDGTEYEFDLYIASHHCDSYFTKGGIKEPKVWYKPWTWRNDWRDLTDDELERLQDDFQDEICQECMEHSGTWID